jgi:TolB protein
MPSELQYAAWTDPNVKAHYVAFGNLSETTSEVAIQAWLYDVTNPSSPAVVGKIYRGAPTDAQVRKFAHQFADEIISKLSGGRRASLPRKSLSLARAPALKKSGSWIMTVPTSIP